LGETELARSELESARQTFEQMNMAWHRAEALRLLR
jgi:hypothetical protein